MVFHVGDKVIHSIHGLGDVIRIEDKVIRGQVASCYVVRTPTLTVWVPVDAGDQHSLRAPTSKSEFESLFAVLRSPYQPLPDDRIERKKKLRDLLKDGQTISLCRIVRDLSSYGYQKKLSDEDKSILTRAKNSLLAEWVFSLSVPLSQAQQKMGELLKS